MHWFCKLCNVNAISTIKLIQEVKKDVENTNKTVENLSSELKEVKASYADIVSRISDLEKKRISINHNDILDPNHIKTNKPNYFDSIIIILSSFP